MESLTPYLIAANVLLLIVGSYFAGKVSVAQKDATDTSRVAFFASILAMTDAKALKNSTVINRIVEKYNPISTPSATLSRPAQEMQDELEQILEVDDIDQPKGRERANPAASFNEEDLV